MDSEIETHHHEAHGAGRGDRAAGRRPAGLRHRRRGARRGQHDGLGRPAAGGARRDDRLGAGRHLPRHPARLRLRRAAGRPARSRRSTTARRSCSASRPRCSPACRATRRRWRSSSAARCCTRPTARPSPSSKATSRARSDDARAAMAGDSKKLQPIIIKRIKKGGHGSTMAAPGRSPMPTS